MEHGGLDVDVFHSPESTGLWLRVMGLLHLVRRHLFPGLSAQNKGFMTSSPTWRLLALDLEDDWLSPKGEGQKI